MSKRNIIAWIFIGVSPLLTLWGAYTMLFSTWLPATPIRDAEAVAILDNYQKGKIMVGLSFLFLIIGLCLRRYAKKKS